MKINDKILPCPFCGELPVLHFSHFKYTILHQCDAIKANIGNGKKQEVLKKWNKRSK
jgi:hypothetical protein